jgi:hypothetical protein
MSHLLTYLLTHSLKYLRLYKHQVGFIKARACFYLLSDTIVYGAGPYGVQWLSKLGVDTSIGWS